MVSGSFALDREAGIMIPGSFALDQYVLVRFLGLMELSISCSGIDLPWILLLFHALTLIFL